MPEQVVLVLRLPVAGVRILGRIHLPVAGAGGLGGMELQGSRLRGERRAVDAGHSVGVLGISSHALFLLSILRMHPLSNSLVA